MKKTAVEWYESQLKNLEYNPLEKNGYSNAKEKLFEQANEMFEQQIIDACNQTEFEDIDGMGIHETITKGEEYYNETFNK
jgi:uncharacterized protein YkuJ